MNNFQKNSVSRIAVKKASVLVENSAIVPNIFRSSADLTDLCLMAVILSRTPNSAENEFFNSELRRELRKLIYGEI